MLVWKLVISIYNKELDHSLESFSLFQQVVHSQQLVLNQSTSNNIFILLTISYEIVLTPDNIK